MKTTRSLRKRILPRMAVTITVTSVLVMTACGADGGDAATGRTPVRFLITSSTWDVGYAPFAVAQAQGYFEDENLDVEFQTSKGPSQVVQLLEQGSGDVSPLAFQSVVQAVDSGGSLQLFSNFYTSNIYGVMVPEDSEITEASQLAGTTIGVTSLASGGVLASNAILDGVDLTPDDVEYVAIGVGGQAAEAVSDGRVDAISLFDTQYALLDNAGIGLRQIEAPAVDALIGGGLSALSSRIEEEPELFAAIGRAVAKGVVFSLANPEAAVHAVWDLYPTTRGDAEEDVAMREALTVLEVRLSHLGLTNGHTHYGEVSEEEVNSYTAFLEQNGVIDTTPDPADVQTNELIEQINDFDRAAIEDDAASM